MAKILEKLAGNDKKFLCNLLSSIVENRIIREANLSAFNNMLSRYENKGYDVSGFQGLVNPSALRKFLGCYQKAVDYILRRARVSELLKLNYKTGKEE